MEVKINEIYSYPQCDFWKVENIKRELKNKKQWFLKESEESVEREILGGPTYQVFYVTIFAGLILAISYILFTKYGDFFGFDSEVNESTTQQPEINQKILFTIKYNN